jgi:hypothetical protein
VESDCSANTYVFLQTGDQQFVLFSHVFYLFVVGEEAPWLSLIQYFCEFSLGFLNRQVLHIDWFLAVEKPDTKAFDKS